MTSVHSVKLDAKGRYHVGTLLGQGAQGAVYSVVDTSLATTGRGTGTAAAGPASRTETPWVVKLVKRPPGSSTTTAKKKKTGKALIMELNLNSLNHEQLLYHVAFASLCGKTIPQIPINEKGMNVYGIDPIANYNYFIMERMEMTLFDVIPLMSIHPISSSTNKNNTIPIGWIANRLVEIAMEIHTLDHIICDIKLENFMITTTKTKSKKNNTTAELLPLTAQDVATRLRLVDLGLVTKYVTINGIQPNITTSTLVGNSMYAGLNVHDHQTISRRDDIESLLYMMGDFIIQLYAQCIGTYDQYIKGYTIPCFVPWSQGMSDEEVGTIKQQQVSNIHSEYYQRMPHDIALVLKSCWDKIRTCPYNAKPNYTFYMKTLSELVMTIPPAAGVMKKPTTTTTRGRGRPRGTAKQENEITTTHPVLVAAVPPTTPSVATRRRTRRGSDNYDDHDNGIVNEEMMDDQETTTSLSTNIPIMTRGRGRPTKSNKGKVTAVDSAVVVVVVDQEGKEEENNNKKLSPRKRQAVLEETTKSAPVRQSRRLGGGHVGGSSSSNPEIVDVEMMELTDNETEKYNNASSIPSTNDDMDMDIDWEDNNENNHPHLGNNKKEEYGRDKVLTKDTAQTTYKNADLVIIEGPNKGMKFTLQPGQIYNIGSNPQKTKTALPIQLTNDTTINANHAEIRLVQHQRIVKIEVLDLSSNHGTWVNDKLVPVKQHRPRKTSPKTIFPSDCITIGSTIFKVVQKC